MGKSYTNYIDEFIDECKFRIGERVEVYVWEDVIPADEVMCRTGVIRNIRTRFMLTDKMRSFGFDVWLDARYHPMMESPLVKVFGHQIRKVEEE